MGSKMPAHHIRLARYSELDEIAVNHAASFLEDGMYAILFPYRREHYEDYVRAWRHRISEAWWDYNKIMIVSTTMGPVSDSEKSSSPQETITGMALWRRAQAGSDWVWPVWGAWDPRLFVMPVITAFHRMHHSIFGNRAMPQPTMADPDPLTHLNLEAACFPFMKQHFLEPPHRRLHWQLSNMSVHPKYQGRGFGRALVQWGLDRAKSEGLPAVVIGGEGLEEFYEKCGFEFLVGYATDDADGHLNPLKQRGVPGGGIRWTRVKEDGENLEGAKNPVLVAAPDTTISSTDSQSKPTNLRQRLNESSITILSD
jgi:GNAT superfamily N-acetyltransferase